jgi:hypothetical protein
MTLGKQSALSVVNILVLVLAVAAGASAQAGGGGGGGGGYEYDCGNGWDDDGDGDTDCDDADCSFDPGCTGGGGGGGGGGGVPDPPEHCALRIQLEADGYTIEDETFHDEGTGRARCEVEASKKSTGFSAEIPCVEADGADSTLTPSFAGGKVTTAVHGWQVYDFDFELEQWVLDSTGYQKGIAKDYAGANGSYHEFEDFNSEDGTTETPYMRTVDHDLRIALPAPPSGVGWAECRSHGYRIQMDYDSGVWRSDYGRYELTRCGREELPAPPPPPPVPIPPVDFDEHYYNLVRDFEDGATRWESRSIVNNQRRHDPATMITTLTNDSRDQHLNYSAPDVLESSGDHRGVTISVEGTGMPRMVKRTEYTGLDVQYTQTLPGPWPEYKFDVSYRKNVTAHHVYHDFVAHQWLRRLDQNEVEHQEFSDSVVTSAPGILPLDLGNLGGLTPPDPDSDPRYTAYYDRRTTGFGTTHDHPQQASLMSVKAAAGGGPLTEFYVTWDFDGELDWLDDGTTSMTNPTAAYYDEHLLPLRDVEADLDNGEVEYFPDSSGSLP